ncbi:hypothetical protein BGZ76_009996 [Entomortierella beljakovae]|nr:hypothetical protein BGZ76_009996 [Entomortierella beljakovae]
MSGFQFGLNVKKKGPVMAKPKLAASRPLGGRAAFGDNSSDEDDLDEKEQPSSTASARPNSSSTAAVNKTLRPYAAATLHSSSVIEQQNAALAEDPTIFDYDGVYDQLKAGDRARELARKKDSQERKPKYFEDRLKAAELKKKDRQIAEERRIEREREKEGDEFKDKEMFITPAYKAQKEEMRKAEEEERKREEMIANDKDGSMMQGFYRSLLDERSRLRPSGQDLAGVEGGLADNISKEALLELEEEKKRQEKSDRDLALEAREKGLNVALNDDGKIVDKRDLLLGGLNITKKPTSTSRNNNSSRRDIDKAYAAYRDAKRSSHNNGRDDPSNDQRSRMTEKIEKQLLEQQRQEEEEERQKKEQIRETLKRKNQDENVMDAKARYLARKAAAATKPSNNNS